MLQNRPSIIGQAIQGVRPGLEAPVAWTVAAKGVLTGTDERP